MSLAPLALVATLLAPPTAGDKRYLDDFEFIKDTVAHEGAVPKWKGVDWEKECERLLPQFKKCAGDAEHVKNVMELLATLKDSHTGVVDTGSSGVKWEALPSKWDGLFGGGLGFRWDDGRLLLRAPHVAPGTKGPCDDVPRGSVLLTIGDLPATKALAKERERIARFMGISTDDSLWGSMHNKLLPFGEQRQISIEFLTPEGKREKRQVVRFASDGKAFQPSDVELPEGIAWGDGAISGFIDEKAVIGYLRVTGSQDADTAKAFHAAFDKLKGMKALLLDGRGMGGGGDGFAWEMCGRLYPKGANNGRNGRIEPSGDWQFDGPVVFLQDALMVSSAETFAWAVTETGRTISVGATTGGWGIIPKRFQCPSGLVAFRLGVNDRPTPIKNVHTEGEGWPADVRVPCGPKFMELQDAAREVGLEILGVLASGVAVDDARAAWSGLVAGDVAAFKKKSAAWKKAGPARSFEKWAKLVQEDIADDLSLETAWLGAKGAEPFALSEPATVKRLSRLVERAKKAGLANRTAAIEAALKGRKRA